MNMERKQGDKQQTPKRSTEDITQIRKEMILSYIRNLRRPLKIIRSDPLALTGTVIICFLTVVAILAPALAPYDPHAMHERTEGLLLNFVDGRWDLYDRISERTINDLAVIGDEIWAVGNGGEILHYSGDDWKSRQLPTGRNLYGLSFPAPDWGMVVGESGEIWSYDPDGWIQVGPELEGTLRSVDFTDRNFGIAVGDGGLILVWDGQSWRQRKIDKTDDLYAVSLLTTDLGFIAGENGLILRWDGDDLHRENLMSFRDFYGISVYSESQALAVGERGTIFRYDGMMWRQEFGPESRELRDVIFTAEDRAIICGKFGVLLEHTATGWERMENRYRRHLRAVAGGEELLLAAGTDPYINELSPPSRDHIFGTTHLGRDIFSQMIYGTRTALFIGFITALFVNIIGVNVGLWAGYFKGAVDSLLMRIVDIMYALPFEPFAMILVLIFRPSLWIVILAISLLTWRTNARVIRSQVLSLAERPFIKAARVIGASNRRILYVHIAPNILPLAFLQLAVAMGYAITAEATLSFLGLGPPRMYSWGTILHAARLSGAWRTAWWWIIPPGVMIMITVVSVFFISRALEVMTNPRLEEN